MPAGPNGLERMLQRGGDAWIALAAIANVVMFFRHPDGNPIHAVAAPFDTWWALSYGLGGLLIVVSILWHRPLANIEAGGWALLIAGALVQMVVFVALAIPFTTSLVVLLGFLVLVGLYRIRFILRSSATKARACSP